MGMNSPSKFGRRVQCRGSGLLEAMMPKGKSTFYADEGTAAHKIAERCFNNRTNPSHMIGVKWPLGVNDEFTIDEEFAEAVDVYLEYIRTLDAVADETFTEERYELSFLGENEYGLADFVAYNDHWLEVVDYKHGAGIPVEAVGNVQGLCYGIGAGVALAGVPWQELRITIVQPRCWHKDGPVRTWAISRDRVLDYFEKFQSIADETGTATELVVGDGCKFCLAKPVCPAQKKLITETMGMKIFDDDWEEQTPVSVAALKPEEIRELMLKKLAFIRDWCNSVEEYAKQEAERGNLPPRMKLVPTRPRRYFRNGVDVASVMKERFELTEKDIYEEPKIRSVNQLEKRVGKKRFLGQTGDIVEKRSSGTVLVDESDSRSPVKTSGRADFDDADETTIDDLLE